MVRVKMTVLMMTTRVNVNVLVVVVVVRGSVASARSIDGYMSSLRITVKRMTKVSTLRATLDMHFLGAQESSHLPSFLPFFLSSFLFYLWFAATDFSVDRVVEMHTIEPPEMSPNLQLSYKVARAAREEYSAVAREGGNGLDLDIDDVGAADADADADVVIVEEESTMDEAAAELASALAQRLEVVAAERRRAAEPDLR